MKKTDRRALLGVIVAAPLLPSTANAAPPRVALRFPADAEVADILAIGAVLRCDMAFAALCATALGRHSEIQAAARFLNDAETSVKRAAPYPESLISEGYFECMQGPDRGKRTYVVDYLDPTKRNHVPVRLAAERFARENSISVCEAFECLCREWEQWRSDHASAKSAYMLDELGQARDAAWDNFADAHYQVLLRPARSMAALQVKLALLQQEATRHEDVDAKHYTGLLADVAALAAAQ